MDMQLWKQRVFFGALALGFSCLPLVAQTGKQVKVDYSQVRPCIQSFELALSEAINSSFPNQLGIMQKPRGAYLRGFGYEFSFLLDIRRAIQTPFGPLNNDPDKTPEQRKQRVENFKDNLVRLLLSNGRGMAQLQPNESIAIIAHFDEFNPAEGVTSKTLILSVLKKDLDEIGNKQDRFNEFKQRVKTVEY